MSLRDTIAGARKEISQSGNPFVRNAADEKPSDTESDSSAGFSRRSSARAKPSREAASSVRVVSVEAYREGETGKAHNEMTKAERRAKRDRERAAEDRRAAVSQAILNGHAGYKRASHIWWGMLAAGMVAILLSWAVSAAIPVTTNNVSAFVSITLVVIAYALIIVSFIYDWRVVRPMRRAADEEVARMSDRRVKQYIEAKREADQRESDTKKPSFFSRFFRR